MTHDEAIARLRHLSIAEPRETYRLLQNREDREDYLVLHNAAWKMWHPSMRRRWVTQPRKARDFPGT